MFQSLPTITHPTMLHLLTRPLCLTTTNKPRLCPTRMIHLSYHLNVAMFEFMTLHHPVSKEQHWNPAKMILSSSLIQMENLSTQRNCLVTNKRGKYFVLRSQMQQGHLPNQLLTVQAILSFMSVQTTSNNLHGSSIDSCSSQFQTLVDIASQKYPSSKVLISSLLKRRDGADHHRSELNSKLGRICAPFPNVHLVNNENIPIDYLHDNKHLKRRKIGALVANLKDVIYNRIRPPHLSGINSKPIPPLLPRPPLNAKFQQPILHNPIAQSRAHLYPSQPSYAAVASMTPPETTPPAGSQMQSLNINTVLDLLKLYESTRHK